MRDKRRTDPRSPVQPDRLGILKLSVLAALGIIAIVTIRNSWFDIDLPASVPSQRPDPSRTSPPPTSSGAQAARGDLAGLFSGADYPEDALRNEEQGRTTVRLDIDERGRVSGCNVLASSGSRSLDEATCRILRKRARFTPALDDGGRPVPDSHTQTIVWRLQ